MQENNVRQAECHAPTGRSQILPRNRRITAPEAPKNRDKTGPADVQLGIGIETPKLRDLTVFAICSQKRGPRFDPSGRLPGYIYIHVY